MHEGSSEIEEYFYLPLGPLADWFVASFPALAFEERAANFATTQRLHQDAMTWADRAPPARFSEDEWLSDREAWWGRHFLQAGAEGALLPNLALVRDDESLVIDWAPPPWTAKGPLVLFAQGRFAVPWDVGEEVIRGLVNQTAGWLREAGLTEAFAWAEEQEPLTDRSTLGQAVELLSGRTLEELESALGAESEAILFDALGLDPTAEDPAASPQCQILRDVSPGSTRSIAEVLPEIGERLARVDDELIGHWSSARAIASDAARPGESPEDRGYLAASALRESLGLDGGPVSDVEAVARQCGLSSSHSSVKTGDDRMVVGLREGCAPGALTLVTPRTEHSWGQRFETARAVGHVLLDPVRAGALGAASGPFAQETRRRRSGAFAAELLLPSEAIAKASGGHLDGAANDHVFQGLLDRYGVGAQTAAYQLWNQDWLSSETVRDDLILRFQAAA